MEFIVQVIVGFLGTVIATGSVLMYTDHKSKKARRK